MEDLYVEIKFQTAAASFVGTKSRNVVIVDESRDFAARYRTEGNSWSDEKSDIIENDKSNIETQYHISQDSNGANVIFQEKTLLLSKLKIFLNQTFSNGFFPFFYGDLFCTCFALLIALLKLITFFTQALDL